MTDSIKGVSVIAKLLQSEKQKIKLSEPSWEKYFIQSWKNQRLHASIQIKWTLTRKRIF